MFTFSVGLNVIFLSAPLLFALLFTARQYLDPQAAKIIVAVVAEVSRTVQINFRALNVNIPGGRHRTDIYLSESTVKLVSTVMPPIAP